MSGLLNKKTILENVKHLFRKRKRIIPDTESEEIKNYYDYVPEKKNKPAQNDLNIEVPFRMIIVGQSGTGKTNIALNIIEQIGIFDKIIVVTKNKNEPLYELLPTLYPTELIEGIEQIPPLDTLANEEQTCIIFDDLVLEKKQDKIEDYYIRGRKIGKGICMMYISQDFYRIPKIIRVNSNYIIVKRLTLEKDINMILSEFSIGDKDLVESYYNEATQNKGFLLIDMDTGDINKRFRKNFKTILQ